MTEPGTVRLGRTGAIAAVLALGTAILGVGAAPWLVVPFSTALATGSVAVRGTDAVPSVPAAALVVLAAGLTLALAGRLARVVASGAVVLAGILVAVATGALLADPRNAALAAAAEATGVREVAGPATTTTAWPVVAIVLGVLTAAAGVVVAVVQRSWSAPGRRYEASRAARPAASGAPGDGDGRVPGDTRVQAMDDWDALSRGEDPT